MTSPLDTVPATQLEIFGTREMITALGKALIKKGVFHIPTWHQNCPPRFKA
jgi:hypothetical protein